MTQKTVTTLGCDRCPAKRVTNSLPIGWLPIATEANPIILCRDCANAFRKFLHGGATKAVKA